MHSTPTQPSRNGRHPDHRDSDPQTDNQAFSFHALIMPNSTAEGNKPQAAEDTRGSCT
jgi:hypothetical protein